jgi:CubicO group peptidase (beta-lactamase class C family)
MFQAYHGVTAQQHQTNFNTFIAQGYRMISLSVYGDPGDARYAAVWVKRDGAAWAAVHGVNSDGYQAFFNAQTAQGFVPVLVSATGTASNAIFAAVFEKGIAGVWVARHGMTSGPATHVGTFQAQIASAAASGLSLRSMTIYGTASDRRYAAIWHANPLFVKWHVHPADTAASYQTTFNAETQLPGYQLAGYRPAYVTLSSDQIYCSVFKDEVVGAWVARHGLTAAQYQTEFDRQNAQGFYPICVQGGGAGNDTRYAAIFAKQDIPLDRQWSVEGAAVPALAALDQTMKTFMQTNGVRAAQIAVGKNGTAKLARAYTWAESGYRATKISDRFLLASCSKMFLEAAVQSLYDDPKYKLLPSTKVYPFLGFSHPADPRSDLITIQELLDHMGGFKDPSAGGYDPTYDMRNIAINLGLNHPVTRLDVARYMYGRMLDYAPGSIYQYSNYGYLLAGTFVEKLTGMAYFDYVSQKLLQPAGISEVGIFSTLASGRNNDEAIAEDEGLGGDPLNLSSQLQIPKVYGGGGEINEVGEPNDGLCASARALVQFIHLHAVWGNGGRAAGAARSGSTDGASSFATSRGDGVDWAYVINTRDWPPSTAQTLTVLDTAITNVLNAASI